MMPSPEKMKHELLLIGKTREAFIADGIEEYAARLRHYTSFVMTTLKDRGRGRTKAMTIEEEGSLLLQAVLPGAIAVVLDPRGKQFTSEEFTRQIASWEQQGHKQICYLIGGPEGHCQRVIESAALVLSLSRMTFTHEMSRMLLVEQLYRAYTIKAGERYHK